MKTIKQITQATMLLVATLLIASCAQTIYNVHGHPVPKHISLNQVTNVITSAAHRRGWSTSVVRPGVIMASYTKNNHYVAKIKITYSTKTYSINYVSSKNLLAAQKGLIHPNYNRWIKYLDHDIKAGLNIVKRSS